MKQFLKKFLCVALCAMLLAVGFPVAAEAEEPIRILAIGNSFSNNATYYISRIAESMGKEVSVTSLYYAGCTIKQHVEFYNSDSRSYQFYVDGVNTTTGEWQTMKDVFELCDYDYVTLQQSPSGSDVFSTYWTEENPWLTQLYDIVKKHEPQAEIMVHQTWSFCHDCAIGNDPYWDTNYNNSKEMFDVIEGCYEQMADKIGVDKETGIIPVGVAIQLAKDEYGYGDFYNQGIGLNDAQHCANGALYTDNVDHLNMRGRYIAGCVWLEKIFGYDCRTATYFPEGMLTAEECEILRAIAHEAVTGDKAYVEGDWRVLPDGDGVEIVHYMGKVPATGTLAVPTVVGDKTVTRVDDSAFKYIEGLHKLILPDADIVYEDGAIDKYDIIENLWDGTSIKPTEGSGTETDPYKIYNGSHLYWAVTNKNTGVYFELQNDILLNDIWVDTENGTVTVDENVHEWYLGGANESIRFEGILDGKNHVIRGLYIDHDFAATASKWNYGAGLIARAGNGAKIKNLAIDGSFVKALNAAASAFVGTTGSGSVDVGFENSYIGENVYVYGAEAGGFIGAGNGAGLVSGIADCYVLGTIKADGFVGALLGGVWGGTNAPITNCYATMKLHGQTDKTYTNCYAPEKKNTYDNVTVVSLADMKGKSAITKLAGLNEVYTLPADGYPVLKAWAGKADNIWSGFAVNTLEGDGTQSSPYLISDGEGLAFAILNCGTGKYYKLTKHIYLNDIYSVDWETAEAKGNYVPSSWLEEVTFNGYFDGSGYAVYGIYHPVGNGKENSTFTSTALFPLVNSNTHIKNVGVRYSHIEIFGHAAGIVGFIKQNDTNKNIVIDSCFVDETNYIVHTRQNDSTECSSAGILGGTLFTPNIAISNCYSLANLSGPYNNAHIIGSAWQAPETVTVTNCYSVGKPWMNSSAAVSPKTIENCYSTIAPNATYGVWTQLTESKMQGANALVNMLLGDKFVATEGFPKLKVIKNDEPLPPAEEEEENEDTIKVLAIGNSYSNNATKYISSIAESMGVKVSVTSLYDDGCSIERHVNWYNTEANEYEFYVDGVNVSYPQKNTMQEVFERDDYDYITIQQGPGPATDFSTYWTEEKPWLTDLYEIIKRHEPQAEVMIHQTWSFCHDCAIGNDPYWNVAYENSLDMFQRIENAYEQAADKLGLDKETDIIPSGKAVQLAKDEYGYGDFYNEAPLDSCANGAIYNDNIDHLNARGQYLAACVWLEKIFGADCRTATYYPTDLLTADDCKILRAIAHEAVTGEKAYIEGDWRVLPDGDGVEIVHYMGKVPATGTLAVPTVVGDKTVTRVDDSAFKYIEGLHKLILPDADIFYEDGAIDKYEIIENLWDGTSIMPTEGSGTETDPYKIYNGSHLYWAVTNKNTGVYFKLQNDILLNDILVDTENGTAAVSDDAHEWYLGGANSNNVFEGVIDGDYHVIRGLYIDEDFGAASQQWNIGAGLIARGGNGMKIKNLGIDNSFVKAVNGTASAFVGTTGAVDTVDIGFENSFIGEDVYLYGTNAGGFIGGGNGAGYVSGVINCYCLGTVEASSSFFGAVSGGVWSGFRNPVTNFYATKVRLHGQHEMTYTDCYAPAKKADSDSVTVVAESDMKGQAAITKLAALSDVYTLPADGYPVLKSWVGKGNDIWSGFAVSSLNGDGTEDSPYLITNGEELVYAILGGGKGKYYRVENDIYLNDINGVDWSTGKANGNYVPSAWISGVTFTGYFDGNGHIVYGIYYPEGYGKDLSASGFAALIPQITKNTHVTNVGVRYSRIEIFGRAAGIVGSILQDQASVNILIDSCFTDETVYVNHSQLNGATNVCSSGIVGGTLFTPNVKISNCYSFANLSGPYSKGKIIGSTWEVPTTFVAENCYGDGSLWLCSSAGNAVKTAINSYSTIAPNATYTTWRQLSESQMQGANALVKMPLGDKFVATKGYPVLKIFIKTPDVLAGDVNGDGLVDITDLATLKLYLAGADDEIAEGADMDGNGKVDTGDLASLKLYLAQN